MGFTPSQNQYRRLTSGGERPRERILVDVATLRHFEEAFGNALAEYVGDYLDRFDPGTRWLSAFARPFRR